MFHSKTFTALVTYFLLTNTRDQRAEGQHDTASEDSPISTASIALDFSSHRRQQSAQKETMPTESSWALYVCRWNTCLHPCRGSIRMARQ